MSHGSGVACDEHSSQHTIEPEGDRARLHGLHLLDEACIVLLVAQLKEAHAVRLRVAVGGALATESRRGRIAVAVLDEVSQLGRSEAEIEASLATAAGRKIAVERVLPRLTCIWDSKQAAASRSPCHNLFRQQDVLYDDSIELPRRAHRSQRGGSGAGSETAAVDFRGKRGPLTR